MWIAVVRKLDGACVYSVYSLLCGHCARPAPEHFRWPFCR